MSTLARDANGHTIQAISQGKVHNVAYTGTAGTSAAMRNETRLVQLVCSSACYYLVSAAGTAATSSNGSRLPADVVMFVPVGPGYYISFVQDTTGGTANITEGL